MNTPRMFYGIKQKSKIPRQRRRIVKPKKALKLFQNKDNWRRHISSLTTFQYSNNQNKETKSAQVKTNHFARIFVKQLGLQQSARLEQTQGYLSKLKQTHESGVTNQSFEE